MLAEEDDRHDGSEHRHHVEERRGAVGADQLHAAIEAEIGDRRGKQRDIDQRQQVRRIDLHRRPREQFPDEQRDQAGRAGAEGEGDERQAVDVRAFQRQHRIDPEDRQRHDEDQVADVELDIRKRGEVAMQQDDEHAGHRQQDARRLRQRQPHAEQQQRPHRDHQRACRLQQQRVQRLGVLERPVLQGIERADAGDGEQDHDAEAAADRGPVADQMLPGERQDDQECERPAQERKRHRRDMAGGQPSDDGVAGPAQRGDAEQQIRLVGEPVPGRGG